MDSILDAIVDERRLQERLKAAGKFRHTAADAEVSNPVCLTILVEEVGEVARLVNDNPSLRYPVLPGRTPILHDYPTGDILDRLRSELIQVAAVAVAWIEKVDNEIREAHTRRISDSGSGA